MSEKGSRRQGGANARVEELSSLPIKRQQQIFPAIKRIEKKTFPATEAFDFDAELKKRNTRLLVAVGGGPDAPELLGYLVVLRMRRTALVHKVCVAEAHRRKGVARDMLRALTTRLKKEACDAVQLWVDEARAAARGLCAAAGFLEADRCADYYGPGRTGIKMVLQLQQE